MVEEDGSSEKEQEHERMLEDEQEQVMEEDSLIEEEVDRTEKEHILQEKEDKEIAGTAYITLKNIAVFLEGDENYLCGPPFFIKNTPNFICFSKCGDGQLSIRIHHCITDQNPATTPKYIQCMLFFLANPSVQPIKFEIVGQMKRVGTSNYTFTGAKVPLSLFQNYQKNLTPTEVYIHLVYTETMPDHGILAHSVGELKLQGINPHDDCTNSQAFHCMFESNPSLVESDSTRTFLVGRETNLSTLVISRAVLAQASPQFQISLNPESQKPHPIPTDDLDTLRTLAKVMADESVFSILYREQIKELYGLAKRYLMYPVMDKCLKIIWPSTVDDLWHALDLATSFNLIHVKEAVMDIVRRDPQSFLQHVEFPYISNASLLAVVKLSPLNITSEVDMFLAVLGWGRHQCEKKNCRVTRENIRKKIGPAFRCIRFLAMSLEELMYLNYTFDIFSDPEIQLLRNNLVVVFDECNDIMSDFSNYRIPRNVPSDTEFGLPEVPLISKEVLEYLASYWNFIP